MITGDKALRIDVSPDIMVSRDPRDSNGVAVWDMNKLIASGGYYFSSTSDIVNGPDNFKSGMLFMLVFGQWANFSSMECRLMQILYRFDSSGLLSSHVRYNNGYWSKWISIQ